MTCVYSGWRVITCSRTSFPKGSPRRGLESKCPWAAGTVNHVTVDLSDPEDVLNAIAEIKVRFPSHFPLISLTFFSLISFTLISHRPLIDLSFLSHFSRFSHISLAFLPFFRSSWPASRCTRW